MIDPNCPFGRRIPDPPPAALVPQPPRRTFTPVAMLGPLVEGSPEAPSRRPTLEIPLPPAASEEAPPLTAETAPKTLEIPVVLPRGARWNTFAASLSPTHIAVGVVLLISLAALVFALRGGETTVAPLPEEPWELTTGQPRTPVASSEPVLAPLLPAPRPAKPAARAKAPRVKPTGARRPAASDDDALNSWR